MLSELVTTARRVCHALTLPDHRMVPVCLELPASPVRRCCGSPSTPTFTLELMPFSLQISKVAFATAPHHVF